MINNQHIPVAAFVLYSLNLLGLSSIHCKRQKEQV